MDTAVLDASVQILKARKDEWAQLHVRRKCRYLEGIIGRVMAVSEAMVAAAVATKGIPVGPSKTEEWAALYCIVRFAQRLKKTLEQVEASGMPQVSKRARRTRADGQLAVRVFPATIADRILFRGFRAEVWMQKGITGENLAENMACFYRQKDPKGRVALVLGAGNFSSIGPMDVLTKLYADGKVCLLKLSPVNQYLGPFIEEFFGELIRDGYVRTAYGGADVGAYLCDHPDIDDIHITGSHLTHDAIVFGSGEEGRARKNSNSPRLAKSITSELGNVSPIIVVPGPWSDSDLQVQAENITTQMIHNCGFNCCAAKVLILPRDWPLARALMDRLQSVLAAAPQRLAYYPGAEQRYNRFVSAGSTSIVLGSRRPGVLPWTILPDLDPEDATNICYTTESFCGLMAQTALSGTDPAVFLRRAAAFCNEKLWGTLSACILVHPTTERLLDTDLERAIAELRYGAVGINHWPMLSFAWGSMTWGAFPEHTYQDIQSGIGVVHNAMLFDKPERTVMYGPFHIWPKPAWFLTNRNSEQIIPKLVRLEAHPGVANLLAVLSAALRG